MDGVTTVEVGEVAVIIVLLAGAAVDDVGVTASLAFTRALLVDEFSILFIRSGCRDSIRSVGFKKQHNTKYRNNIKIELQKQTPVLVTKNDKGMGNRTTVRTKMHENANDNKQQLI